MIDEKDILGFAIERASALNGLWNLYIAVATAGLGLMASGKAFTTSNTLKWILTIAFGLFAISNLVAIVQLGELRESLIKLFPLSLIEIKDGLEPAKCWQYIAFHLSFDVAVIVAIWKVPWSHGTN